MDKFNLICENESILNKGTFMSISEKIKNFFIDLHNQTILFRVGNYIFVTYGTFLGLGFFAGLSAVLYYDSIKGLNLEQLLGFYFFILLPAVLIGVRLLSIIENILDKREFQFSFRDWLKLILAPGFNIQGGILIGFITTIVYSWVNQIPILPLFDGCALGIALGESIGRIGCHTYGCCWGKPTHNHFGIAYRNPDSKVIRLKPDLACVKLHPVQMYSAFTAFLLFLFLYWLIPYVHHDGTIAAIFLILHGGIRLFMDKFRDDPRGIIFKTFLLSTLSAYIEIFIGVFLWIISISFTPSDVNLVNENWTYIYTQPSITLKIIIFTLITAFYFGSHYYRVGTWVRIDEG